MSPFVFAFFYPLSSLLSQHFFLYATPPPCFLGVRAYTQFMLTTSPTIVSASASEKVILDCRDFDFRSEAQNLGESLLSWVRNFPRPSLVHIYLPSSAPHVRQLQCTLLALGCAVFRVTKCA